MISISMDNRQAIKNQIKSETLKNTLVPYWPKLEKGGILFRGTYHELKQQELIVTVSHEQFPSV